MLHHHRLRMREVAVRMFQRGGGVSSIRSGKSAYYMVKVLLALFVGLARARPDSRARRRRSGCRRTRHLMETRIQIVAIVGALGAAGGRARDGAPPAPDGALRAAVAVQRRRDPRARGLARCARAGRHAVGIYSPPNALFFIALGFILVLLLHFSAAVSRLADQSKVLAQRQAIVEQQLGELRQQSAHAEAQTQSYADEPVEGAAVSSSRR